MSPWEKDGEYRRRSDRYGPRHSRTRIDSCDEDGEYDAGGEYEGGPRLPRRDYSWASPGDRPDIHERPIYSPWSPEDEQRRNFERNTYERSTYGPPHLPKSLNTYDRRTAFESREKYYRDRGRMDFPFEDPYGDIYEEGYRSKRNDYENVYDEQLRSREYFNSKDKRSFDSNDSYDSRGRYGSGEIYGYSDHRERCLERGRLMKGRNAQSKPDLEQDSDAEMSSGSRRGAFEGGSLQRPRPKPIPIDGDVWGGGQKPGWRPTSANEPDRRRIMGGSLAGSDGEKDRRIRRKMGGPKSEHYDYAMSTYATMRYPMRPRRSDYYDYDKEQTGDDLYYQRRQQAQQQYYKGTHRSENRSMNRSLEKHRYDFVTGEIDEIEDIPGGNKRPFKKSNSRDLSYDDVVEGDKFNAATKKPPPSRKGFEFYDFEDPPENLPTATPNSSTTNAPATKFNFEEGGFESDFNSPIGGNNHNKKSFRFTNEYSDKDSPKQKTSLSANYEASQVEFSSPHSNASHTSNTMKLRFNENVKVSQFDPGNSNMFEDDFSKTNVDTDDQWSSEMPLKKGNDKISVRQQQQQEIIKKSESVNIFAKKKDFDPFEDDPFFGQSNNNNSNNNKDNTEDNSQSFANFDANM